MIRSTKIIIAYCLFLSCFVTASTIDKMAVQENKQRRDDTKYDRRTESDSLSSVSMGSSVIMQINSILKVGGKGKLDATKSGKGKKGVAPPSAKGKGKGKGKGKKGTKKNCQGKGKGKGKGKKNCQTTTSPSTESVHSVTEPPSLFPSLSTSTLPSTLPSISPTVSPTIPLSTEPTIFSTNSPSMTTSSPSIHPTMETTSPSVSPSLSTYSPSISPSVSPTPAPTITPTFAPTVSPSQNPTISASPTTLAPTTSHQPTAYDCSSPSGRNRDINIIFSDVIDSLQSNTPQQQAFDFIVNDENFNACSGPDDLMERYVLAVFYYSTGGDQWQNNRGWLSGVNHCSNGWHGITCGSKGEVDQIKLQKNNLNGIIPIEIATLHSLSNIRLFDNNLEGTVPSEIYDLQSLFFMDLEENNLSGELFPPDIFNATTITKFRMSNNNFSGTIPPDIGRLTGLEQLWLANNEITGSIPAEITELTSMQRVIFYGNELTGLIPQNIGAMTELDWIDISVTNIHGSIPPNIGNLEKLRILILQSMSLTGTLPQTMSNLINLEEFLAEDNSFEGSIPDFSTLPKLEKLILFNNTLSGPISEIGPNLAYIDVRQNSLSGTIPDALFSNNNNTLQSAYFSNNTFSGPIPSSYAKVTSLVDLWLDGNDLTGTIPDIEEGDLPAITEILFDENRLSGSVPDGICDLISAIPEQFVSLHADCYPKPGTDIPNNPCSITCCTDCGIGK